MKRLILSGLVCVLFCTSAVAESSVWKAEKDGSVTYLGGTCHILRPSDLPLPPEFDAAYDMADLLVFETDLIELQSPETQQKLMAEAKYADGSTLKQHLSPEIYSLLTRHAERIGLPMAFLNQFKPSMVAITLTMMEFSKEGITQEGVDLHYSKRAAGDHKPVEFFETIDEQIAYVTGMGAGNEDALIRYTLEDIAETKQLFGDLIDAWKSGDADKLNTLMNDWRSEFTDLYSKLITDRNKKWMPQIEAYQTTPAKEFILVGVSHLVGPDGILALLKQKGFSVENVQQAAAAESPKQN